jgi:hypothetical protein
VADDLDIVARYGISHGWTLRPRTVLVEGSTDAALFDLGAAFIRARGTELLGEELAIVAAGEGEEGGARGVTRELIVLRNLARAYLSPSGRPVYRFIALFDNDTAGRKAINGAKNIDTSIIEFKDVFRLHPIMPCGGNLDPTAISKMFEKQNSQFKGLDWEIEDLLSSDFIAAFLEDNISAIVRHNEIGGRMHRDFTRDGKAKLHRFTQQFAMLDDVLEVVQVIHSLRFLLGLPDKRTKH